MSERTEHAHKMHGAGGGDSPADGLTVAFADNVTWRRQGDGSIHLASPAEAAVFRGLPPAVVSALEQLQGPGIRRSALREQAADEGGAHTLAQLEYVLLRLERYGFITYSVVSGGRSLLILTPTSPHFSLPPTALEPAAWQLSRFACWRLDGARIVAESTRGHGVIHMAEPGMAAVLAALARPLSAAQLAEAAAPFMPHVREQEWRSVLYLLGAAAVIVPVDEAGTTDEAADPALQMWSFHELFFHARSRLGRHRLPFGATCRFLGKVPPLPAVKQVEATPWIPLPKPDMDEVAARDAPFTRVLEGRRSVRSYGPDPITVEQLGEFLYRTMRVQRRFVHRVPVRDGERGGAADDRSVTLELTLRPSPGGGAIHELEIYVAVNRCQGLAPGLYHYDPVHHRLRPAGRDEGAVRRLIDDARRSAPVTPELQVLIILATRFERIGWKYESMAYALTLKNAGAALQTMYLVATAMGLAPVAVGAGNADLFARAAGTDYYAETSVAEFLLGTAAPEHAPPFLPGGRG